MINIIDLFAGPGGWDQSLRLLDREDVIGVEWDTDACKTAEAAGHERIHTDVARLDPREFDGWGEGIIASPPCQGFSTAGKSLGLADANTVIAAVEDISQGRDPRADIAGQMRDPRSVLALEPLRWVQRLNPQWTAWEQVPAVQPLWDACALALRGMGYSVWTGILHAEAFGVPQTRRRSVLIASRRQGVRAPVPSHSRYNLREADTLDLDMARWVSMSDALGWSTRDLIGFPRLADEKATVELAGTLYRARDLRRADQPAWTLTEKARSWHRWTQTPDSAAPGLYATTTEHHSVRVSMSEASQLQTFPAFYPWTGSRTAAFLQLGNAVPPLFGAHVLAALGVGHLAT